MPPSRKKPADGSYMVAAKVTIKRGLASIKIFEDFELPVGAQIPLEQFPELKLEVVSPETNLKNGNTII